VTAPVLEDCPEKLRYGIAAVAGQHRPAVTERPEGRLLSGGGAGVYWAARASSMGGFFGVEAR
jgi:hypothetical protein